MQLTRATGMHALAAHTVYSYCKPHLSACEGWVWIISGLFPIPLVNHGMQYPCWSTRGSRAQKRPTYTDSSKTEPILWSWRCYHILWPTWPSYQLSSHNPAVLYVCAWIVFQFYCPETSFQTWENWWNSEGSFFCRPSQICASNNPVSTLEGVPFTWWLGLNPVNTRK